MARYRRLVRAGYGVWLGAFLWGELAADLGIFVGDGVARFQAVETAPRFRRRGLCGTLVAHAGRLALEQLGARKLVIVADPADGAARIYETVGFRPSERTAAVWCHGQEDG
jgi:hypothetical protein